ncbi:MAG: ACT domain-containing protein, partial [Bacteroidota bacterium]
FKVESGRLVKIEEKKEVNPVRMTSIEGRSSGFIPKLMINGEDASQYTYSLAGCCNPVQGDEIFGFLTISDGIKIHRSSCPNATHLNANYGYRLMKAEWVTTYNTSFVATLKITGVDDLGVVQRLTNILTNQLRVNMRGISLDGTDGYYTGHIKVVVNNTDQLNFIIKTLLADENVSSVTREE